MRALRWLRAVLGIPAPARGPYGRWWVPADVAARAATRAASRARVAARARRIEEAKRLVRELGYPGLALRLEQNERRHYSARNGGAPAGGGA